MSTFRTLHLSDIHIGKTYKSSESIAYKIVSDIEHANIDNINCIITTGDIFEGTIEYSEKLIKEAVKFYEIILQEINNYQEIPIKKTDFIFVPGNHDIIRDDNKDNMWVKYRRFLEAFYDIIPDYYNLNDFSVFKPYHSDKILFIGFNSCQIEKRKVFDKEYINKLKQNLDTKTLKDNDIDKDKLIKILEGEQKSKYDDYGLIPMSQISGIKRKLKEINDYNIIALFHHHFYLFPEISYPINKPTLKTGIHVKS